MTSTEIRDVNFSQLRQRVLSGQRMLVYRAWIDHGPGTTRQIAQRSGIDILNVRPRTTELLKCGALIEMDNDQETPFPVGLREGIYRVRLLAEWAQWHSDQVAEYISGQQQLL
jgi:hypothetical protein